MVCMQWFGMALSVSCKLLPSVVAQMIGAHYFFWVFEDFFFIIKANIFTVTVQWPCEDDLSSSVRARPPLHPAQMQDPPNDLLDGQASKGANVHMDFVVLCAMLHHEQMLNVKGGHDLLCCSNALLGHFRPGAGQCNHKPEPAPAHYMLPMGDVQDWLQHCCTHAAGLCPWAEPDSGDTLVNRVADGWPVAGSAKTAEDET